MGQKTHPIGFRLGVIRTWDSRWFAKRHYADLLKEDLAIRKYLTKRLENSGLSKIVIERRGEEKVDVIIHTSKPGMVIGRSGQQVNQLRDELKHAFNREVFLDIKSVDNPDCDAQLVGESIAKQLEQRVSFRRAMKKAVSSTMRSGALGIRVMAAGRLGGAEMSRVEGYREGRVPLHTLRADIDFARVTAVTAYGAIGVKVWIFKGEVLDGMARTTEPEPKQQAPRPPRHQRNY
ncbi:MAG: 30S ribosomal protein S3 [Candidatus Eisenbacteria bacterium]|nr:30S ribosomal protein S3 [Candidatus Eisenbacteria bacterium]MCC7141937.1 30S ribosomal protein S3 [Candidatus Eisenbacteria bacterium]